MPSELPIHLAGESLRKAVQKYYALKEKDPQTSHNQRINKVAVQFDLSPLQCDFLSRHLHKNPSHNDNEK